MKTDINLNTPFSIEIYTDGSCYPNDGTGQGGWGFIVIRNGLLWYEDSGKECPSTNNRMETRACIEALKYCLNHKITNPVIYSDSKLIVNFSSRGQGKKNRELIGKLSSLRAKTGAVFKWIKGHSNNRWNDYVDALASYKR